MTLHGPTVAVYCEGTTGKPHAAHLVEVYEQDLDDSLRIRQAQKKACVEPQPHYWRALRRERWQAEGYGQLPQHRQNPRRLLGRILKSGQYEKADRLTAEQADRAFFSTWVTRRPEGPKLVADVADQVPLQWLQLRTE